MTKEQNYLRDIAEIRSMMERSSKFLTLSGWAGIMAGTYALLGAWVAWKYFPFHAEVMNSGTFQLQGSSPDMPGIILIAVIVLILAISTAIFLSIRKARARGEKAWNATSRRLLTQMAVPLVSGGILMLLLWTREFIGLMAPLSLLFYGIALYNAGRFTYTEVKYLGLIQIVLGLICSWFPEYGLFFWAMGFGVVHILYGIQMHFKYERGVR